MTMPFTSSSRATLVLGQTTRTLYALPRPLSHRHGLLRIVVSSSSPTYRAYSSNHDSEKKKSSHDPEKKQVAKRDPTPSETDLDLYGDGINPPRTTLPPPLTLPEKKPKTSMPIHWYHIGRAYGKFYIAGVKQTWANYKKAKGLRAKIRKGNAVSEDEYPPRRMFGLLPPPLLLDVEVYMRREGVSRSQLQLLVREREDFKKLPLFAVLVALFGEWLPLIVPFIPGRVPKTCRIPKQVTGMRKGVEERRRESFRKGIMGPFESKDEAGMQLMGIKARVLKAKEIEDKLEKQSKSLKGGQDLTADLDEQEASDVMALRTQPASWLAVEMTQALDRKALGHVSTSLGLHGKIWETLGLVGGESAFTAVLLKMRVAKRLHYLNLDDELLVKERTKGFHALTAEELEIACEERGIDVVGRTEENMRRDLGKWLEGRSRDKGHGEETMKMLFRRPNTW